MNLRAIVRDLFLETLQQVEVSEVMRHRVRCEKKTLHVGELYYPLQSFHRILVISIGKAASPMYDALLDQILPDLDSDQPVDAIVVGSTPPRSTNPRTRYFTGSHPFPNQSARDAADAILNLLVTADEHSLVLFLISGGASAMVERALDKRFTTDDEIAFHRALVQSGLPITQMNPLRKHFSQVKGGRLAIAAQRATQCTLLVSDVPVNMLHVVGSGPSLPDPTTIEECRLIIRANYESLGFKKNLLDFFLQPGIEETPKPDNPAFARASWLSLLSSDDLCLHASEAARRAGFHVVVDNACDDWTYQKSASYLIDRLEALRKQFPKVCLLSAGEVSVHIPSSHGTGGRNQHFALECARLISDRKLSATVLSGGSDGVDGSSPAAGAVCDETTFTRAVSAGLNPLLALERFDSYCIFRHLGDTIVTGPTGNNIRDLRILMSIA